MFVDFALSLLVGLATVFILGKKHWNKYIKYHYKKKPQICAALVFGNSRIWRKKFKNVKKNPATLVSSNPESSAYFPSSLSSLAHVLKPAQHILGWKVTLCTITLYPITLFDRFAWLLN